MITMAGKLDKALSLLSVDSRKWFITLYFAWTGLLLAFFGQLTAEYVGLAALVIGVYSKYNVDEKALVKKSEKDNKP